jgi:hypothetical protein
MRSYWFVNEGGTYSYLWALKGLLAANDALL